MTAEETADRLLLSTSVKEYAYVYTGGSLMQLVVKTTVDSGTPTTQTLNFRYDANGTPMSVSYNGTEYFYVLNLQSDITAIVNSGGTAVVRYTYDAWGNILTTSGSMANTLGEANPLRYRGYVYDQETGLYYLQSRYYDPEIGRFINADAAIGQMGNVQGNNMFAYAFNNPMAYSDATGNWPKLSGIFLGIAVAAVAVAVVAAVVVSCGAAVPVMAVATGTVVSSASAVAAVTTVGLTACSVAIAATAVSAAALVQEETAKKSGTRNHSVYVLKDDNDEVQYVGRTVNIQGRALAHSANPARAELNMEVVATGLSFAEARALEQAGMIYHHTINTADKMNNQINGIAPKFWDSFKVVALGALEYQWNQMTNEILYWAGS